MTATNHTTTHTTDTDHRDQDEPLAPEIQVLALAALAKQIKAVDPAVRAAIGTRYHNGDTATFRSPLDGRRLGKVRRNDPDPTWTVTDPAALDEYLRGQGRVVTTLTVADADWPEALAVLEEHAPGLLTETTRVPPGEIDGVLAESAERGEAAAPGVGYVVPDGSLVVTVDPATGVDAAAALVRAGRLDWSRRPELGPGNSTANTSKGQDR